MAPPARPATKPKARRSGQDAVIAKPSSASAAASVERARTLPIGSTRRMRPLRELEVR
jgi:hypothetical protein